jgi:hypothetical protein
MRHHPLLEEMVKGTIHNMAVLGGGGGDHCRPSLSSVNTSTASSAASMSTNTTTQATSLRRLQQQHQQLRSASSAKLMDTKIEQLARLWNTAHVQFSPRRTAHDQHNQSSRGVSSATPHPQQPSGAMIALCVFIDECLKQRHRKLQKQQQIQQRSISATSVPSSRRGASEGSVGMEPLPSPPLPTSNTSLRLGYSHLSNSPGSVVAEVSTAESDGGVEQEVADVRIGGTLINHTAPPTQGATSSSHSFHDPTTTTPLQASSVSNGGFGGAVACKRLRDAPGGSRVGGKREEESSTSGGGGSQQYVSKSSASKPAYAVIEETKSEGAPAMPVLHQQVTTNVSLDVVVSFGTTAPSQDRPFNCEGGITPLYEHLRPPNLRPSSHNRLHNQCLSTPIAVSPNAYIKEGDDVSTVRSSSATSATCTADDCSQLVEMEVGGLSLHRHPSPVGTPRLSRHPSPPALPIDPSCQEEEHHNTTSATITPPTINSNGNSGVPTPRQTVELVEDPHRCGDGGRRTAATTTAPSNKMNVRRSSPQLSSPRGPRSPIRASSSTSPSRKYASGFNYANQSSLYASGGKSNADSRTVVAPSTSLQEMLSGTGDTTALVRRRRQPGVTDSCIVTVQNHTNRRSISPQSSPRPR